MTENNTGVVDQAHGESPQVLAWRQRGSMEKILGHEVFVIDWQPQIKPTLLLIHGFPTSSWDWHLQFDDLAKHFRLVTLDMLGFGFSDKPKVHQYSIMEQADIIEHLLIQRGVSTYAILAHDYGDTVAQELLARQNHRTKNVASIQQHQSESTDASKSGAIHQHALIEKVVLLNGGLFPESHRARPMQKLLLGPLGPMLVQLMGKRTLAKNMVAVFGKDTQPDEHTLDTFWELIQLKQGNKVLHRLMNYIRDRRVHRQRWVDALRQCNAPVALIIGSADPVSGTHMVERYRQLVSSKNIVELPQIGHYPQVEAPDHVLDHTLEFLVTGLL